VAGTMPDEHLAELAGYIGVSPGRLADGLEQMGERIRSGERPPIITPQVPIAPLTDQQLDEMTAIGRGFREAGDDVGFWAWWAGLVRGGAIKLMAATGYDRPEVVDLQRLLERFDVERYRTE
jgi:hypothetical protein